VESYPVLNVNQLSAMGRLHPGWSGTCQYFDGVDGDTPYSTIVLRAETNRLILSWHAKPAFEIALDHAGISISDANGACGNGACGKERENGEQAPLVNCLGSGAPMTTQTILLDRRPRHFGGYRTYFLCPGSNGLMSVAPQSDTAGSTVAGSTVAGSTVAGSVVVGGSVVDCGRRVTKLYLLGHQFLCRHCAGLVHASKYEPVWQRGFRRTIKLQRRRLAAAGIDAAHPEKPKDMPVDVYARMLDDMLQAELQAIEARSEWFQRLVARVGKPRAGRHKPGPQFTLDE
jgi:hypothetical protein